MSQIKTFKSYAKVNLGLKVLDLLPDNYHSIFTIIQEIDFYDIIDIQRNNDNKINLFCDGAVKVPSDKNNLCYQAAELIFKNYNITSGINSELALLLGCDVPFFIKGGTQISEGKGQILTPLNVNISQYNFLLVFPPFNISTKWAYSFFKKDLPNTFDSDKFRSFQGRLDWKLFENDFENIIKSTYPEVVEIRRIMEMYSSVFVSLSGSGSTMFGVFEDFPWNRGSTPCPPALQ